MIENKKKNDKHYYLDLLHHMTNEARIFGYRILTEYYDFAHFNVPECVSEHHVAGVILLSDEMIYSLHLYIKEIICVNHSIPYFNIDTVITNNFLGGYISCDYLIKKGYKQIGFVGEVESSKNFKERYQGYRQCMINHFPPQKHELICLTKGIEKAVLNDDYRYIQKMLLTYRKMPEAFVCVNDRNAAIVINALQYNGYKVPQDIKVIGLSTPGIIRGDQIISMSIKGLEKISITHDFTLKYSQKFVFSNDANTIALGYYSSKENCSSLSFVFQPVSSNSGAGHIVNDRLIAGHHHVAGEIQYLPLSYSKDVLELHQTPEGAIEAMAKTVTSIISFLDPQIIVICCFLITNIEELKKEVAKYIPKDYIPEIVLIDYLQEYMLLGTLLLCHQD